MPLMPMNPALRPPGTPAGFDAYAPDEKFRAYEMDGKTQWSSPEVPFIESKRNATPLRDLDPIIIEMLRSVWEKGVPKGPQGRGPLAGTHKGLGNPDPTYNRLVNPIKNPGNDPLIAKGKEYLTGMATDWRDFRTLKRVVGFTFRGDTRGPSELRTAGGFHPPSTRTDGGYTQTIVENFQSYIKRRFNRTVTAAEVQQAMSAQPNLQGQALTDLLLYMSWREMVKREELHVGRHVAAPAMKGCVSTTKAVDVAKGYAGRTGTVFVTFVDGAFLLPPLRTQKWTSLFNEQEVTSTGPIWWHQICGWRRNYQPGQSVNVTRFMGPIILRTRAVVEEPVAMQQVYDVLSGKPQV